MYNIVEGVSPTSQQAIISSSTIKISKSSKNIHFQLIFDLIGFNEKKLFDYDIFSGNMLGHFGQSNVSLGNLVTILEVENFEISK